MTTSCLIKKTSQNKSMSKDNRDVSKVGDIQDISIFILHNREPLTEPVSQLHHSYNNGQHITGIKELPHAGEAMP